MLRLMSHFVGDTLKVVAFFDTLFMRLLGICLASFSSGM